MTKPPRMVDVFGIGVRVRMSRRRRIAQDCVTITPAQPMPASCCGESLRIWGEPIAMDALPPSDIRLVTFDGALPSHLTTKDPR